MTDTLSDFTKTEFTADGKTRDVYRIGTGPAVVVIAEIPGITPKVADFGRKVAGVGCTAWLPRLFGTPGKDPSMGYILSSIGPACVSREFACWAAGRTSPVTVWLRALAAHAHAECGGPGVGAVGMCFTGGFALAMMVDDVVKAPVLSQPSLPFPISGTNKRAVGVSDADLERVKQRCAAEADLQVLGLRFTGDRAVPPERFESLRSALGDKFIAVELDSSPGNPHGHPKNAHSVLTEHLQDRPGTPTHDALQQVLEFFRTKLAA